MRQKKTGALKLGVHGFGRLACCGNARRSNSVAASP